VGSVWGRSRGLIFLGLLVVPVALLATFLDVPFEGGVGYRSFTPATPADAADGYHLFAGRMQVDLTEMDWSEPVTLDATVAFGVIEVAVPRDVDVRVTSHAGAGRIVLFGQERVGTALDFDLAEPAAPGPGGGGTLDLDAEASFGQVLVHRAGEPADPTDTDEGYFGPLPTGPAIPSPTAVPSPPVAPSPPPAPSPPAAPAPGVDQRTLDELFPIGVRP
jgi:hypothetical protein